MGIKLYDETVHVAEPLRTYLQTIISNHAHIHNNALSYLKKNPTTSFSDLKSNARLIIRLMGYKDYQESLVFNDLHYLYKRFQANLASEKYVDGLGYLSIRTTSYNSALLQYNSEHQQLNLLNQQGFIALPKSLPSTKGKMVYMNISYSPKFDEFRVAIFK